MSKTKPTDEQIAEAKASKAAKAAAKDAPKSDAKHLKETKPSVIRLRDKYRAEVVPALQKEFGYKNIMAVPKVKKVVVNMGLGEATSNAKVVDTGADRRDGHVARRPHV
jgi:Ribosomal protein L5